METFAKLFERFLVFVYHCFDRRRSIGTLYEFAEGLRLLEDCPEFTSVVSTSDAEAEALWNAGVDFFRSKKSVIKLVRNDIGGHFGSKAAVYAVANLSPKVTGKIELKHHGQNRDELRFHFAGERCSVWALRQETGEPVTTSSLPV